MLFEVKYFPVFSHFIECFRFDLNFKFPSILYGKLLFFVKGKKCLQEFVYFFVTYVFNSELFCGWNLFGSELGIELELGIET